MADSLFIHLKSSYNLLDPSQKREGKRLALSMIFNVFLDLFSLVSILPLVYVIFNEPDDEKHSIVSEIRQVFNFSDEKTLILSTISVVLFFFILKTIYAFWVINWKAKYATGMALGFSNKIYKHLLEKSHDGNVGEMAVNITNIPYTFINKTINSFFDLSSKMVLITVVFFGLAFYDPDVLFYLSLVIVPVALIYLKARSGYLKSIKTNLEKCQPALLQRTLDSLNGKTEIILSGNKNIFFEEFSKINLLYSKTLMKRNVSVNSSAKFIELIALLGICVLFICITLFDYGKEEIFFTITVYSISAYKLIPSINGINVAYVNLKTHQYTTEIIEKHLKSHHFTKTSSTENVSPLVFKDSLSFKDVTFIYPDSLFTLKSISFSIQKYDKVAIIGESGSGKSTILQLILRTLSEAEGNLLVDEQKITSGLASTYRKLISYVPQSVFLFEGTLLENICMKDPELMKKTNEVNNILEKLGLAEISGTSEKSLNYQIQDKGANVSSGQKQRIGIARALMQNREIFVLDEITSNLDEENQTALISFLQNHNLDKTMVFATHRTEIMTMCNVIIEVKAGKVKVTRKAAIQGT